MDSVVVGSSAPLLFDDGLMDCICFSSDGATDGALAVASATIVVGDDLSIVLILHSVVYNSPLDNTIATATDLRRLR